MTAQVRKKELDRLIVVFVDRVTKENDSLSLHNIRSKYYPDIFVAYATYQAKKIFDNDSPFQLAPHNRYPYRNGEIKESLSKLKEIIILETVFTNDEIVEFTEKAFRLQIDSLIMPRRKLLSVLFKQSDQVSKDDILTILNGFDERRCFIRELITAVKISGLQNFSRQELDSLSQMTEKELFSTTPISTFLSEVTAYMQFESSVLGTPQAYFHSDVLQEMLRERDMSMLSQAFLKESADGKDTWTMAEIENTLGRHLLVGNLEEGGALRGFNLRFADEPMLKQRRRHLRNQKSGELEKRQFSFFDDNAAEDGPQRSSAALQSKEAEEPSIGSVPANVKNGTDDSDKVDAVQRDKDESQLIEALFSDNANEYDTFMERIARILDWEQAKLEIERELFEKNVSPFAKEALLLGDVVFSKYFAKK